MLNLISIQSFIFILNLDFGIFLKTQSMTYSRFNAKLSEGS